MVFGCSGLCPGTEAFQCSFERFGVGFDYVLYDLHQGRIRALADVGELLVFIHDDTKVTVTMDVVVDGNRVHFGIQDVKILAKIPPFLLR